MKNSFAHQTLRGKRHIASMMAQYIAYRSHTPFNPEHISKVQRSQSCAAQPSIESYRAIG
jgi:hypothetical protein